MNAPPFFQMRTDCPSDNKIGYKAILVDEDEYLLGLVRYIHHNPLKAGMVKKLKEYEWST
jgi:REP element-mobilizing transposase RayT